MAWLQGCASVDVPIGSTAAAPPPEKPVQTVQIRPISSVRLRKPTPAEDSEPPLQPIRRIDPDTIIVLSNDTPEFMEFADQLNALLAEPARVYTLADDALLDQATIAQIEISSSKHLIAVGLTAARALRKMRNRQVVFCGVVNYHDYDLVSENMKGVGAMPSPGKLFADWRQLSPQLNRVLVITGPGFEDYVGRAQERARQHRIRLNHQVVESESDFIAAVQQNTGAYQGHWIVPDDSVLNTAILKRTLAINSQQGVQSVVFSQQSLAMGGLFYVAPSTLDVSRKVIDRFQQSRSSERLAGESVVLLDDHEFGINARVARRLGIQIPADLRPYIKFN